MSPLSVAGKKLSGSMKKYTMVIVLVAVYIFFLIGTGGDIFKPQNFNAIITQNAYVYILAVGMLMCMLTGGNIDLSCGSFVCLLGAIGGVALKVWNLSTGASIAVMLLVAVVYGCLLGFLIAYVHIPPWIATLAGYLAFRGLGTSILSKSSSTGSIAIGAYKDFINIFSGKLFSTKMGVLNIPCMIFGIVASLVVVLSMVLSRSSRIKKGYEADSVVSLVVKCVLSCGVIMLFAWRLALAGGIPTVLLWVLGVVLIYSFITNKVTYGRHFYVVGGNMEASRLSGINTKRVMFFAYLNMTLLTAVTTFVVLARMQAANASNGTNFEMDAISACVVGGVSASGGSGTIFGMVIGATLIGVINLGMSLMGVDMNWQKFVKGVVLLGAVAFDILSRKKRA